MPTWTELDPGPRLTEQLRDQGVRWLRLRDADDQDLLQLAGLPLKGLSLRDCERVRGTGLSALAGMPLQHLDLAGTSLVHTSLELLAELPLEVLILSRTPLLALGRLREALEARGDDMAARMVLSEVWAERYTFRWEEGYGDFWVEDEGPPDYDEDPQQPIPALSEDDLVELELDDHERWRALRSAAELYDVDLSSLHGEMAGFAGLPRSLRILELAHTPFGDREARVLAALPELRMLGLAETAVSDLESLRPLRNLTALDLAGTRMQGLRVLTSLVKLRGLRLGRTRLDAEAATALSSLPCLESLAVHDAAVVGGALAHLAELPGLRQLSLYRCELAGAQLGALGLSLLEELDLTRCRLGPDRSSLGQLGNLRLLRLSKSDLELGDLEQLRRLQDLEVLGLGFVDLPREALEALQAAMPGVTVELAFREDEP